MSNASAANIVSLDDYRRSRMDGSRRVMPALASAAQVPMAAVWVYWVPVWVW